MLQHCASIIIFFFCTCISSFSTNFSQSTWIYWKTTQESWRWSQSGSMWILISIQIYTNISNLLVKGRFSKNRFRRYWASPTCHRLSVHVSSTQLRNIWQRNSRLFSMCCSYTRAGSRSQITENKCSIWRYDHELY